MRISRNVLAGVGTALGVTGTALQTNEILEMISLIITIIGALISFVVIPLLNWLARAKKDGKITTDEVKEGLDTLKDGINGVSSSLKRKSDKKSNNNETDGDTVK